METPRRLTGRNSSLSIVSPSLGFQPNASSYSRPSSRPQSKESPRKKKCADRFIPTRHAGGVDRPVSKDNSKSTLGSENLAEACGVRTRILEFQVPAPAGRPVDLRSQYVHPQRSQPSALARRRMVTVPERVLDAPGVVDDYYLNLIDWGPTNQLAIALERSVYVWNASSGAVSALCEQPDAYISSVKWSADGYLAVGLSDGNLKIWDTESETLLRTMTGRNSRLGVLSWDRHMLSSGGADGAIWNHDVRIQQHKTAELQGHEAEVCGLSWRGDGTQLASGGNDNVLQVWDARSLTPRFTKTHHTAAVKGLAWCPWQSSLLASGGGTQDKHIHLWNTATGQRVNSVNTGSQVTALHWNAEYRELVSCHGFPSNTITVWNSSLVKQAEIEAHDSRVLYASLSPDRQTLATCAADENLKFWKLFETSARKPSSSQSKLCIR